MSTNYKCKILFKFILSVKTSLGNFSPQNSAINFAILENINAGDIGILDELEPGIIHAALEIKSGDERSHVLKC